MDNKKKTRKNRKQKGGNVMTFLLGAISGGLLASVFGGSSGSPDDYRSSSGISMTVGGGKKTKNVKKIKTKKNNKSRKNKK
tara:strand:+ start:1465 stop:1707 length:243 start_codon:yes stop_codon:yes gene_type:complete